MKKPRTKNSNTLSRRVSFPEEEKKLPWLSLLLDAHAIADTGTAIAIRDEEKRRKSKLACSKGCGNCCAYQKDLPLYPHELVGIYWYVSEKMEASVRHIVKRRLADHSPGSPCPFLVDRSCSIHPVRPLGCRQFNVFNAPCAPDEDPYFTRRDDVLVPLPQYTDRVFVAVLPLYNMKQEGDIAASIKLIRSQIMNLLDFDWKKLVVVIEQSDTLSSQ